MHVCSVCVRERLHVCSVCERLRVQCECVLVTGLCACMGGGGGKPTLVQNECIGGSVDTQKQSTTV